MAADLRRLSAGTDKHQCLIDYAAKEAEPAQPPLGRGWRAHAAVPRPSATKAPAPLAARSPVLRFRRTSRSDVMVHVRFGTALASARERPRVSGASAREISQPRAQAPPNIPIRLPTPNRRRAAG